MTETVEFKANLEVFVSCCESDVWKGKKYKAHILKYVPCILKYMACIFCNKPCVFLRVRKRGKKHGEGWGRKVLTHEKFREPLCTVCDMREFPCLVVMIKQGSRQVLCPGGKQNRRPFRRTTVCNVMLKECVRLMFTSNPPLPLLRKRFWEPTRNSLCRGWRQDW